jgi:hypothetical protein
MSNTPSSASGSTADAKSAVGSCPARQAEIFIVPARYALAEEAIAHSTLKPPISTKSQPTALRKLRQGYLYLWHGDGPLRRFAVAQDGLLVEQSLGQEKTRLEQGSLAGLALDKSQDAWLMHSEAPLTQAAVNALADARTRRHRMQRISLTEVARRLESSHCPALVDADKVVAELTPEARQKAMAYEYGQHGQQYQKDTEELGTRMSNEPDPEKQQALQSAYISASNHTHQLEQAAHKYPEHRDCPPGDWSVEPWNVLQTEAWLGQAKSQAAELYTVFAALEDDPGMLRDLNRAQAKASEREEEWDQQNAFKGLIAGFINSLIEEDGAELAGQINYRYRDRDILLSPEEGEMLLQTQRDLKPLLDEETEVNVRQRHRIGHAAADARIADIKRREEQVLAPTRAFIPIDLHGQLQDVVMHYRAEKARNMTDSKSGAQVAQRVRLDLMQNWIDNVAEPHRQWLTSRRDNLLSDSKSLFARQTKSLWYADYLNPDHCDWLSELSLNTLSEVCSTREGVKIAVDLLRAPNPDEPFSLLATGFSPELASFVDSADRANDLLGALEAESQQAVGVLVGQLVGAGKLAWLRDLGGQDKTWGLAVSRLSAAFLELSSEHLAPVPAGVTPANPIQRFPWSLKASMLVMRLSGSFAIKTGQAGWRMTGPAGQALWDWGQQGGQLLQRGLTPLANGLKGLNTYGGALPLAALALHLFNLADLLQRDAHRQNDGVRGAELTAESFKVGAALAAVIGTAWSATGQTEARFKLPENLLLKAPIITFFGGLTGALAAVASIAELAKLAFEMQRDGAYWRSEHWVRLAHDGGMLGLASTQAGLGGYATWMALTNRWTTQHAISWFVLRMVPVGWLILLVEAAYFIWTHWFKDTELQNYLDECCWGKQQRWSDTPEGQNQELQALLGLLLRPRLGAEGTRALGNEGLGAQGVFRIENRTSQLQLLLPSANLHSQVHLALAAVDQTGRAEDFSHYWLDKAKADWIPADQGMGLKVSGPVPPLPGNSHWQLRVLYYAPAGMLAGALEPDKLVVGGNLGLRFLIEGELITEHASNEAALPSDRIPARPLNLATALKDKTQ